MPLIEDNTKIKNKVRLIEMIGYEDCDDTTIQKVIANFRKISNNYSVYKALLDAGVYNGGNISSCTNYWFLLFWGCIPKEHLYEVYKEEFSDTKYYNHFIREKLISEIMKVNQHDTVDNNDLKDLLDADGYLTVYHGHSKNTLRNSCSWTLVKETADWFGQRNALFNETNNYYVWTGKVKLENVIAYITERKEAEIVIKPKHVVKRRKESFLFEEKE